MMYHSKSCRILCCCGLSLFTCISELLSPKHWTKTYLLLCYYSINTNSSLQYTEKAQSCIIPCYKHNYSHVEEKLLFKT